MTSIRELNFRIMLAPEALCGISLAHSCPILLLTDSSVVPGTHCGLSKCMCQWVTLGIGQDEIVTFYLSSLDDEGLLSFNVCGGASKM